MTTTRIAVAEPGSATVTVQTVELGLETFQRLVGGWIEGLTLSDTVSAYINEEGKLDGLPRNDVGDAIIRTLLAADGRTLLPGDFIVGPVVFVGGPDEEGDDTNLPDEFLALLRRVPDITVVDTTTPGATA